MKLVHPSVPNNLVMCILSMHIFECFWDIYFLAHIFDEFLLQKYYESRHEKTNEKEAVKVLDYFLRILSRDFFRVISLLFNPAVVAWR